MGINVINVGEKDDIMEYPGFHVYRKRTGKIHHF